MQHQPLNPDHLAALLQWARKHKFPTLTRLVTGGDPGACMYGFNESGRVANEAHRRACLAWIDGSCLPTCERRQRPRLLRLREYLAWAPSADDPKAGETAREDLARLLGLGRGGRPARAIRLPPSGGDRRVVAYLWRIAPWRPEGASPSSVPADLAVAERRPKRPGDPVGSEPRVWAWARFSPVPGGPFAGRLYDLPAAACRALRAAGSPRVANPDDPAFARLFDAPVALEGARA